MLLAALFGAVPAGRAAEAVNYARPFEPQVRPALLALPPGAVEPGGWLRDWCLAARDGYTGHMDDVHDDFKRAWRADFKMTGDKLAWPKGAWPYEGGGYWFDGLARLGYLLHDESLTLQVKSRLGPVVDNMTTNGIFFLWWLDTNNPGDWDAIDKSGSWVIWASGLLGRAMTGYYMGSGDPDVLEALEHAYSHRWPDAGRRLVSQLWPVYDTYTWTGNAAIRDQLTAFFRKPPAEIGADILRYRTPPALGVGFRADNSHVVMFLENTTPWAVGYLWTGDASFLKAALGWHSFFERVAMQPHGVPVADEWYGPSGAFRGTETCDVAAYLWSKAVLLSVTGDGAMGDRMERAFFNAAPATVTRDFKNHIYFQSPNRVVSGSPVFDHGPRQAGGNYRLFHSPLCCTAALNRILPWYVTHMWMATYDNGLAATCYGPCRVTALAAERVPVEIVCKTDYPFNEAVEMTVTPATAAAFPLAFRIPGWCPNPELRVNGAAVQTAKDSRGFARVSRTWKAGDTVSLRFPMAPVVATGVDQAKGTASTGAHQAMKVMLPEENLAPSRPYATVSYGPLLFALAIPDTQDANTPDPCARWKFALDLRNPGVTVERGAMPASWDWPLDAPVSLSANAVAIDWSPAPQDPRLPEKAVAGRAPAERIKLIPYGCTKFRISMFPVAAGSGAP